MSIQVIFVVIAMLCFLGAAINNPTNINWPRANLLGLGAFFVTVVMLMGMIK